MMKQEGDKEHHASKAHTVLASELVDGVDEAVVQIGRPSEARHLGPVVLPDAPAPLPAADHRRPHHGHLSLDQLQATTRKENLPGAGSYIFGWMPSHFTCTFMHMSDHPSASQAS